MDPKTSAATTEATEGQRAVDPLQNALLKLNFPKPKQEKTSFFKASTNETRPDVHCSTQTAGQSVFDGDYFQGRINTRLGL